MAASNPELLMKLSTLLDKNDSESVVVGVEVDCECLSAPAGIETVGFLYENGSSGLSENLMDAIITFNLSGIRVILEVPHDADVDPAYLMKLASNAGFSIALIPGAEDEAVQSWGEQCANFVPAFLSTPNFSQHLYPVQGYFTYLIAEKLGGTNTLTPTDDYVKMRFTDPTPTEWSDAAKAIMRNRFAEICGGEDGIKDLATDLVAAIGQETVRMLEDRARTSPND
jgi:hypothetical protein